MTSTTIGCVEAEAAVLGALLHFRGHVISSATLGHELQTEDFTDPRHRAVWEAMQALRHSGVNIEPVTVLAELRRSGLERSMTCDREAGVFLVDLMQDANPGSVGHYITVLLEHRIRREVEALGVRMQDTAATGSLEAVRRVIREELPHLADQWARLNRRTDAA